MGALAYAYHYPFASDLTRNAGGFGLRLATFGGQEPNPHFFKGRLAYPREMAVQLLSLAGVAGGGKTSKLAREILKLEPMPGPSPTLAAAIAARVVRARRWASSEVSAAV